MFEWITGGGILAILGFIIAIKNELDKKVDRTYQRLDKTKDYQDATFTRKDICGIIHKQIADDLFEIKSDLKRLLKDNEHKRDG